VEMEEMEEKAERTVEKKVRKGASVEKVAEKALETG